ncbi:MAG: HlyD family efflux transporter periplasmic adaptor subunit [Pirellulales bacterium]
MATTSRPQSTLEPAHSRASHENPQPTPRRPHAGVKTGWMLALLGVAVVAAIIAVASAQLLEEGAASGTDSVITHTAGRGELLVTVTEQGEVESATNVDIKCEVAGGSTILWIIPDGELVNKGDRLVELDASALEDSINTQRINYEKARATMIQSEKEHSVAEISVREYLEGTYQQQLQDMNAQVTIALENLRSAQNSLEFTQKMFRKGYVSDLERESQEFAVQRAELELASARTAVDVLERFTKAKTVEDLESQRDTAHAKMLSDKAAFELEEARLKRLESQLSKCVIVAPADGMAVYANDRGRRFGNQQSAMVEEGAQVREQQTLLRLPDLNEMQVKVAVHETKIKQLRPGLRALIRIQEKEFKGTVTSIANQPEAGSFFGANVKEYATIVQINGTPEELKPGMTAEVEILVEHLQDEVILPVAAVVEQRSGFFAWVHKGESYERRPLVLGPSNDRYIAITDGVSEGETVILNPRAVVADARSEPRGSGSTNVENSFGSAPADMPPGGPSVPGSSGRGGPPGGPPREARPAEATSPGAGPPGEAGPGGGGPPAGFNPLSLDTDGDGMISRSEAPEPMQRVFDRIDANGDGQLDQQELTATRGRGGPERPPDGAPDGPAGGGPPPPGDAGP